jgi:hypothetical protein
LCFLFGLGEGEADELGAGRSGGQREESTNWDGGRSGTQYLPYYPGLVCFVRRDKDQQGRAGGESGAVRERFPDADAAAGEGELVLEARL